LKLLLGWRVDGIIFLPAAKASSSTLGINNMAELFGVHSILDYDKNKGDEYFSGARIDWIDQLPKCKGLHILEIGCGYGGSGKYAFEQQVCDTYIGVEIAENAAGVAKDFLTDVLVGDVEKMDLPLKKCSLMLCG
jgi:SAM-dependent methyltransferase